MKTIIFKLTLGAALVAAAVSARALEGAVVIAGQGVPVSSLTEEALKNIYLGRTKYWDNGQAIVIIVLPDQTDAALQQVSGMDGSLFKTYWQRLAFSGRGQIPKRASDAAALVSLVASTKDAIALAPTDAALNGVRKIEIK